MIIKKDPLDFASYLEDTSNLKGTAVALYIPETIDQLQETLRYCSQKQIPVTASSARTGTTGGCVPYEGIILSLEKLNKIIDINASARRAVVQAGVSLKDLEEELNRLGLSFRPQPTESLAFIGGAVSTSASGVRGFRYGSVRKYIRSMSVILSDGTLLNLTRGNISASQHRFDCTVDGRGFKFNLPSYRLPAAKSQAGYFVTENMDLIDLFIGSEGTLGIISQLEIDVQTIAKNIFDAVVFFKTESKALACIQEIKQLTRQQKLNPTSLEFLDMRSLSFLSRYYKPIGTNQCAIYFEQESENNTIGEDLERWMRFLETYDVDSDRVWLGDTPGERKKIYEFRYRLPECINEFLRAHRQRKVSGDIAVPENNFSTMYDFYNDIGARAGLQYVNFGHVGENHLHFNFLPTSDSEQAKALEYMQLIITKALTLGGTVSAEHGIGKLKKSYLLLMYGQRHISEMAALKKYFDPPCILGLDNIFSKKLLY